MLDLKPLDVQILGMLSWRPAVLALLAVNTALCMQQAGAPSMPCSIDEFWQQ